MAKLPTLTPTRVFEPLGDQLSNAQQIVVGFSGGLDSSVLLHSLSQKVEAHRIMAIHINHGLSENADHWQAHAEDFCQSLGVSPFKLLKKLFPCTSSGIGMPAISSKVGAKSIFKTISSMTVPGCIFSG